MQVKKLCSVILGATALVATLAGSARADEAAAPPPEGAAPAAEPAAAPAKPASAAASDSKMRGGLDLVPTPFGSAKASAGGISATTDLGFAFGLMPFFDYMINNNFFVGIGPTYTLNLKPKSGGGNAAKELDISLRLGGGAPVADKIQIYGYASPGYSIVFPPSGAGSDKAKGFSVGFHAGGMYDVTPTAFVNLELGYLLGFESISVGGASVDDKFSLFQIGLGGGIRL